MRYALIIVAVAAALAGIVSALKAAKGDGEGAAAVEGARKDETSSFVPSGVAAPAEAGAASEAGGPSETAPKKGDPVKEGLFAALMDVLSGRVQRKDQPALEERLYEVASQTGIGREAAWREAAATFARDMIERAAAARPGGEGASVDPATLRRDFVLEQAASYAADLYRRLSMGGAGGGTRHEGTQTRAREVSLPEGFEHVSWATLGGFDYEEGMKLPATVAALDGKRVGLSGFMMTLEEVEDIHEFLLLESVWSCCFGVPAQLNQVILVNVTGKKGVDYTTGSVLVLGKLEVGEHVEDGFVTSVYRLKAEKVLEVD